MTFKLIMNSLSGMALFTTNVIVAFVISPVLIRTLGNRDYGLWELIMSVVGYMGLFDLGIGSALVRFVSVADGRQDREDLQATISTAFIFFILIGVLAAILFLLLGYFPGLLAGKDTKDIASIGTVFMILSINACLFFPLQVFVATLMGLQRHYLINNVRIIVAITQAGLVYYLFLNHQYNGLIVLSILTPAFTSLELILFAGAVHLDNKIPKINYSALSWQKAKELFFFASKSLLMMTASRLQNQSAPLIISHMLGLSQIVYFAMPNRLVTYASGLSLSLAFPLAPFFGSAVGRGDHDEMFKSWLNTSLALMIVALIMPITIYFYGEDFLTLWIGKEYAVSGRIVLYVLLIGLFVGSMSSNAFSILTSHGKHGRNAFVWLLLSVISIPVGIIGAYLWELPGVALGTTMVTVLGNVITIKMSCDIMLVSIWDYLKKTTFRVIPSLMIYTVVLWAVGKYYPISNYFDIVLCCFIGGIFYLFAVWYITIEPNVRKQIIVLIKEKVSWK